ncbi:MAG: 50S ribosomal protein L6 [Chloroflexi bacterium]|nr:MAG: 50S ribosomal protein L6 [Chloroflexota bacterium]
MSRVGKMPVEIPPKVTVEIKGSTVRVKGPKGELTRTFHPDMDIRMDNGHIVVNRPSDHRTHRALHGLTRALIANMVQGVSEGFKKTLVIEGVGYRADMRGNTLVLNVGYSHPVEIQPPDGIQITIERGAKSLTVEGIDKEVVGEVAAKIRAVRPPEPYKGKGIRYADEYVRRKPGKAGKVGV